MPKAETRRRRNGSSMEVASVLGAGSAKVKKKIRDIERLLRRPLVPAHIRIENERALKALKVDLQNTQLRLQAKENGKKYHMVRFFERKKAVRRLKQAQRDYDEVAKTEVRKDIKKARKVLKHAQIDVAYTVMFPKTEKYLSLFPNEKEDGAVEELLQKAKKGAQEAEERKVQFRKHVELLIDKQELPFSLEDVVKGKNVLVEDATQTLVPAEEIDAPQAEAEEEEDDFFEE